MVNDTPTGFNTHADSVQARMLPVVEAYEAALRRGETPEADGFLSGWEAAERDLLRRELEKVRRQCSSTVTFHDEATAVAKGPSVGRFVVDAFHARGGLGEVYRATDTELNREVAFKRMQDEFADDDWLKRKFVTEAEVTARLDHPGIVPVYGLVTDVEGRPGYAMRFIRGKSLQEAIAEFHFGVQDASTRKSQHDTTGTLPADAPTLVIGESESSETHARQRRRLSDRDAALEFRALLQRFIAVCQAVAYAHSRGVIHRDIKPSNIMLGEFGETLVVDWGLAKSVGRQTQDAQKTTPDDDTKWATIRPTLPGTKAVETQMGSALGTPTFMAPEQAAGWWDVIGPAADIYSLGATLYVLLTGRPPVSGSNEYEIRQKVQRGEFARPRQGDRDVPAALEAVCLRAMALKPEARYATSQDLARDLERWLADEPVSAWREPVTARAARSIRRHRTLAATGGAVMLVSVVGLAAGLALYDAQNRRLRQVNENLVAANARENAARTEATHNLFRSIVEQSRSRRLAGFAGWRQKNLDMLTKAPRIDAAALRSEAIECLIAPATRCDGPRAKDVAPPCPTANGSGRRARSAASATPTTRSRYASTRSS